MAFQCSSKMVNPFLLLQPPCSFYLDLDWLGQYWNCWEGKGRIYHHTGPVNTMYGLREGLAMVAEEGLENCWRRHRLAADTLQAGLAELGLEMFVPDPKARYVSPAPFSPPSNTIPSQAADGEHDQDTRGN